MEYLFDYNDGLILNISDLDFTKFTMSSFYKFYLKRYIETVDDKKFVFKSTLSYLNYTDIIELVRKEAYKNGDKAELTRLAKEEYKELIKRIKAFHDTLEHQWLTENKGYGFEIHSARLGGLCQRLESCAKRLLAYTSGKIDKIEELETEILPIPRQNAPKGEPIYYDHYGRLISAGVLTMSM
jgi:hypothetical protein